MKKRGIRQLLKLSHAINVLLLLLLVLDYIFRSSQMMTVLLGLYGAFFVWLIILLLLDDRSPFVRVRFDEVEPERRTINYGRR